MLTELKPYHMTGRLNTQSLQNLMDSFMPGFYVASGRDTPKSRSYYWKIDYVRDMMIHRSVIKIRISDHDCHTTNKDCEVFVDLRPHWEFKDAAVHIKWAMHTIAKKYNNEKRA